jgi:6-phosphogluconolactonase (cycloisomerase 2 family)
VRVLIVGGLVIGPIMLSGCGPGNGGRRALLPPPVGCYKAPIRMRRIVLCVALAAASARPVAAETILYATAASENRVDGFSVADNGAPSQEPVAQRPTGGLLPRRLVAHGCNLYVAESDRVEVFRIGAGGRLDLIGATRKSEDARAHDIEVSADGLTLYAPLRRLGAIASYPLDAEGKPNDSVITENGVPAGGPTSCIYGPVGADWEDIALANGKLYAAYTNRIEVFGITDTGQLTGTAPVPHDNNDDGTIGEDETACPAYATTPSGAIEQCIDRSISPVPDRPDQTCSFSFRGHMAGAVGLVVDGSALVSSQRFTHLLLGFVLDATGNFPPISETNPQFPTAKEKKQERRMRKKNKTDELIRYIGLTVLHEDDGRSIIYAAGYAGRVDAFRLREDGTLPKQPNMNSTPKDVTSTPVRTAIGSTAGGRPVLYVASGELDRVQAFRLSDQGSIDESTSPAETNEQKGSFPNDVVPVDITNCD